jgi:tetratricopeptide (TPR) repeat protein
MRVVFLGALLISNRASLSAQQVCPPLPPDEVAGMSDALKKATITSLHLKAYKTGDLAEKVACYDQILNLDPTDVIARGELEKAQQQLKDQIAIAQQADFKKSLLQRVDNALHTGDETALNAVLKELDDAIKISPADKDLADARQRVQAKLDQNKTSQQVQNAINTAHNAYFAEDSRLLAPALQAIEDALKIAPTNAELSSWKEKIQSRIRTEKSLWWLKIVAVITVIAGAIGLTVFLLLRKRRGLLEFADGDRQGEIFQLDKSVIKIGALSEGNDLILADLKGKISRYHCEIVREGKRYFIKDSSTNGTWLNEECLESGRPKVLRKGDRLTLAGEVTFIFRLT